MSKDVFTNEKQLCQSLWQPVKKQKYKAKKNRGGGVNLIPPTVKASRVNYAKQKSAQSMRDPWSRRLKKPAGYGHIKLSVSNSVTIGNKWTLCVCSDGLVLYITLVILFCVRTVTFSQQDKKVVDAACSPVGFQEHQFSRLVHPSGDVYYKFKCAGE